jgi:hypothetical protein
MNRQTALQIAARIWCDEAMSHVEVDAKAAEQIADILFKSANEYENSHRVVKGETLNSATNFEDI